MHSNSNNATPWASICIATFKRPALLKNTLEALRSQKFQDFEVIVSDNDPAASSQEIVRKYDSRFRYIANDVNVGMVKNFNRAISYARGEYVAMLTDDDPPTPEFLATLYDLSLRHPGNGAYFGACEVFMESAEAAASYRVEVGKIGFLANVPEGAVRIFPSKEFPAAFFKGDVFPYILWSTGVVRAEIVRRIGGMPDYGSPLLTDFAYVLLAGTESGCVTINTILGCQSVHGANSGLTDPHNIEVAVTGCHEYLSQRLRHRDDWMLLAGLMEKFLATYIINHAIAMRRYLKSIRPNPAEFRLMKVALGKIFRLNFMRGVRLRYYRVLLKDSLRERLGFLRPFIRLLK